MPSIVTEYYVPKVGDSTYTHTYHSQATITEVIDQVKDVIDTLSDGFGLTGLQGAEWIRQDNDSLTEFPRGDSFACLRHGSNEGYLVHVFSLNRDKSLCQCIITIKYLSDRAFSYQVAEMLNEALYNGCFECRLPPGYEQPESGIDNKDEKICL